MRVGFFLRYVLQEENDSFQAVSSSSSSSVESARIEISGVAVSQQEASPSSRIDGCYSREAIAKRHAHNIRQ